MKKTEKPEAPKGANAAILAALPKEISLVAKPGDVCPYSIKKLSYHRGNEGQGFNLDLYRDGKKVAQVDDAANGGDFDFYFFTHEAREQFDAYLKSLPIYDFWAKSFDGDQEFRPNDYYTTYAGDPVEPDAFIDALINEVEKAKAEKALAKKLFTHTVITLKSSPDSTWTFKVPFTPAVKAKLVARYGDDLNEILNERKAA